MNVSCRALHVIPPIPHSPFSILHSSLHGIWANTPEYISKEQAGAVDTHLDRA